MPAEYLRKRWRMTTLDENTVSLFNRVMRSYICEAAPHITAGELRKFESEALAIEQEIWFDRGRVAGEESLLRWLADNNKIAHDDMAQLLLRSAQSPARKTYVLNILARIVQVNAKVAPHAKPKRGKGRPPKGTSISPADLAVLYDAMKAGGDRTAAIRAAVKRHYKKGLLAQTTEIEGHIKRIRRWIDARLADLDKK